MKHPKLRRFAVACAAFLGAIGIASSTVYAAKEITGTIVKDKHASVPKKGETADGKYSVIAKTTDKTKVTLVGVAPKSAMITPGNQPSWLPGKSNNNAGYTGLNTKASEAWKGKIGALYTNVANSNGRSLDLLITLTDWNNAVDTASFRRYGIGMYITPIKGYKETTKVQMTFTYLDSKTHQPVRVGGYYTFDDIDYAQSLTFDDAFFKHVDKMYVGTDKTNLSYVKNKDGSHTIYDQPSKKSESGPEANITMLYNDSSDMSFVFYGGAGEHRNLDNGLQTFSGMLSKIKPQITVDQLKSGLPIEKVPVKNMWTKTTSFFSYIAKKPLPTTTPEPSKVVSDSDEQDVTKNTLTGLDEAYTYDVVSNVPDEDPAFYHKSYTFTDTLNDVLASAADIQILDENGKDVKNRFTNKSHGQVFQFDATAAALKDKAFYGHDYTFRMKVKIKPDANLAPITKNGIVTIPNQAAVAIDNVSKQTKVVTTTVALNGGISIKKTDAVTKQVLSGAQYGVVGPDKNFVGMMTTDAAGKAILTDLKPGVYEVKEMAAPKGYELDPTTYKVQVTGDTTTPVNGDEGLVDQPSMGRIQFSKKHPETHEGLANATYQITDASGRVVGNMMTDRNGNAQFGQLKPGKYMVHEIQAPTGLGLDPTVYTIDVKPGVPTKLDVLEATLQILPNTGSKLLIVVGVIATLSIVAFGVAKKLEH